MIREKPRIHTLFSTCPFSDTPKNQEADNLNFGHMDLQTESACCLILMG